MRCLIFAIFICISGTTAFSQKTTVQKQIVIKVPNFSDPQIKSFYTSYAAHLIKCVTAIRQKNEAKAIALFKNPGEQLVAREKVLVYEVIKDPAEKQKWMEFAVQASPYLKEVERSVYFQKVYGKQ